MVDPRKRHPVESNRGKNNEAETVMRLGSIRILDGPEALVAGQHAGRQVPIFHPIVTIGRNPDHVDIQLYGLSEKCTVSRIHCSIIYQAEMRLFLLRDEGSSAGTWLIEGEKGERGRTAPERFVNPHQAVELRHGDRVRLGEIDRKGALLEFTASIALSQPRTRRLIWEMEDDVMGTQVRRFNGLIPILKRLKLETVDEVEQEQETEESTQGDIFLSYSRQETDLMQRVCSDLRNYGFTVWTDETLKPGEESWKRAIESAIEASRCIVVILSPGAKKSEWVERELEYARAQGRRIFPLLAKGNDQNAIPFELIRAQRADIRHDYESGMRALVNAVRGYFEGRESGV